MASLLPFNVNDVEEALVARVTLMACVPEVKSYSLPLMTNVTLLSEVVFLAALNE